VAKLPSIRRISREDLSDAPAWIDKLLVPLNQFIEQVYLGLNKQLTFEDNFVAQYKTLAFRTSAAYGTAPLADNFDTISIGLTLGRKVRGILLIDLKVKGASQTVLTSPSGVDWIENNGQAQIRYITGLAPQTDYIFSVLII